MAYIYKITNTINDKLYIGKTLESLEKRFQEHCRDCKRQRNEKRPLYNAMLKYGTENFSISLIEECSDEIVNDREKYWISFFNSYRNGYNATLGGDGKSYVDYDLVCQEYLKGKNAKEVGKMLNIGEDTVRRILKNRNIPIISAKELNKQNYGKRVVMMSIEDEELQVFNTTGKAAEYIKKVENTKASISTAFFFLNLSISKRYNFKSRLD